MTKTDFATYKEVIAALRAGEVLEVSDLYGYYGYRAFVGDKRVRKSTVNKLLDAHAITLQGRIGVTRIWVASGKLNALSLS